MSHYEMKIKRLVSVTTACVFALLPSLSQAAIPARFYPAYTFMIWKPEATVRPNTKLSLAVKPVKRSLASIGKQMISEGRIENSTTPAAREPASINRAAIAVSAPSKVFYGEDGKSLSPELIANFYHIKEIDKPLDVAELIPMDMQPSHDSAKVLSRVADRSLSTFFKSEAVRESTLGQTATTVQQKMKQEVVLGDATPNSVQHKLNFNLQAFQALAQVEYSGLTNAALKYKIAENKLALEVFEKIAQNKDFVVSHSVSSADQISEVSFRWVF